MKKTDNGKKCSQLCITQHPQHRQRQQHRQRHPHRRQHRRLQQLQQQQCLHFVSSPSFILYHNISCVEVF